MTIEEIAKLKRTDPTQQNQIIQNLAQTIQPKLIESERNKLLAV